MIYQHISIGFVFLSRSVARFLHLFVCVHICLSGILESSNQIFRLPLTLMIPTNEKQYFGIENEEKKKNAWKYSKQLNTVSMLNMWLKLLNVSFFCLVVVFFHIKLFNQLDVNKFSDFRKKKQHWNRLISDLMCRTNFSKNIFPTMCSVCNSYFLRYNISCGINQLTQFLN